MSFVSDVLVALNGLAGDQLLVSFTFDTGHGTGGQSFYAFLAGSELIPLSQLATDFVAGLSADAAVSNIVIDEISGDARTQLYP